MKVIIRDGEGGCWQYGGRDAGGRRGSWRCGVEMQKSTSTRLLHFLSLGNKGGTGCCNISLVQLCHV